jgi:hypothetical protein
MDLQKTDIESIVHLVNKKAWIHAVKLPDGQACGGPYRIL